MKVESDDKGPRLIPNQSAIEILYAHDICGNTLFGRLGRREVCYNTILLNRAESAKRIRDYEIRALRNTRRNTIQNSR